VPFAVGLVLTFGLTADDPFITLRYAANVLHGLGPVFNPGQRVEGFTSPLHLAVDVAVVALPGGAKLLEAKLASVLFGILAVHQAGRLIRAAALPRWATRLGLTLAGGSFVLAVSASNGLETTLACFLTTLLIVHLVAGRATTRPWTTGCIAGLCVLARPDALLIVMVLATCSVAAEGATRWWQRVRWAMPVLGVVGSSTAARLWYYGSPVPNTYWAKDLPLTGGVRIGVRYLLWTFSPGTPVGGSARLRFEILFVPPVALVVVGAFVVWKRGRRWSYVVVALLAQLTFILRAGGDWMVGGRFIGPVVPEIVLLEVLGMVAVVGRIGAGSWSPARVVAPALAALAAAVPYLAVRDPVWRLGWHVADRPVFAASTYTQVTGLWMAASDSMGCAGTGPVAWSETGWAGWEHPDVTFLDTRGLTNSRIARFAPTTTKTISGVIDGRWTSPTDPLGSAILAARPRLVISFDSSPAASVLRGAYVRVGHLSSDPAVVFYRRADVACSPAGEVVG